jgi:acyl phosphate:glycerol-3-phosphate acyltransferase
LHSLTVFRNFQSSREKFNRHKFGIKVIVAVIVVVSYLIGSIPTAYLMVRWKAGVDIRQAGSGNVGAFNTFDVTKSKRIGIIVGLLDALKGFVVTAALVWIFKFSFELQAAGLLAALAGHNYPVWLKFKGGRGLATGAGGMFAVGLSYTLVWCIVWVAVYSWKKDILLGNLAAIMAAPLVLLLIPGSWIESLSIANCSLSSFRIFAFVLSGVLMLSHWDALRDLRTKRRLGNE